MPTNTGTGTHPDAGQIRVERDPPDAIFALLGNETRLAILQVLGEHGDESVSFSALQDAVGLRDSGQFNYHLRKLRGPFVRKSEEGYRLSLAGQHLVGALLAGTYTASATTVRPIELRSACPTCAGVIEITYDEDLVRMACADCDVWYNEFTFPPGVVDQFDVDELPAAFDRWLMAVLERTIAGFCHDCAGRVTGSLTATADHPDGVRADFPCGRCGLAASCSAAIPVLLDPAGSSFLFEHGVDVRRVPTWDLAGTVDLAVRLTQDAPPVARVSIVAGDHTLTADVAQALSVTTIDGDPG